MMLPNLIQIGVVDSNMASLETTIPLLEIAERDINTFIHKTGRDVVFKFLPSTADGDSAKALEAIQSFLSMGIQLIVGPAWSSHAQACLNYAKTNDMLLFSGTSTSPLLSIKDDNLFRLAPTDVVQAPVIAKMMKSHDIESVAIFRRGDAWADSIFNYFLPVWNNYGFTYFDQRYPSDTKDFTKYLTKAESWVSDEVVLKRREKIGVLCLSFNEIVDIIKAIQNYPSLFSLNWYGSDGTALSQHVIDNVPEQASKVKIFSTVAAPLGSTKFNDVYDRYFEKTSQPFGFYKAAIYDICWIYALSILVSNTINPEILVNVIPEVSNNYLGVSGICKLNKDGDRYSSSYQIWGYGNTGGVSEIQVYGKYDDINDNIQWYIDAREDKYSQIERNQLIAEAEKVRNEIPLYESDIVEFKQQLIKNNKIASILTSFANSKGGSLYIGVTDDRNISGVENIDKTQLTLTNIARDSCIPPIFPSFTIINENGMNVVQCYIPRSENVHKTKDGKYYNRIGPSTRELSVEELESLFLTRTKKIHNILDIVNQLDEIKKLVKQNI